MAANGENPPVLRLSGIKKSLGGKEIIKGVDLTVQKGELKVLIGPSGGGKSTLLQCINFLHTPDEGQIWLNQERVRPSRKKELYAYRQKVGMIFQDFNLFDHLTALGNVTVALTRVKGLSKRAAVQRAEEELARVGLADRGHHYPAQLSGGQKQRVSIARALAMDPEVILLDEPTSALDPELIGEVLSVIGQLAKSGMTMIMASHQIAFAAGLADEFIFMQEGLIVERGKPSDLMNGLDCGGRTRAFCAKINELYAEGQ